MSKKIIYLMLSVMLSFSLMCRIAYGAETTVNSQSELLQGLDIVCGLNESKLDKPIPKSTFINYALNITGENKYSDYYDENILSIAEGMGIISDASAVSKNDTLSDNEAIAIVVRLLGYELMARESGGYPSGYINVASQLGLLNGVNFDGSVTYSQSVKLLANATECDYSKYVISPNGNIITYRDDVNVLEYYRKFYSVKAQITADDESDLFGSQGMGKGCVKVGETIYDEGTSNAKELLGHYAKVYIKETGDGTDVVIYADDKSKKTFILNAEDIESIEDNVCVIKYYKNKASARISQAKIAQDAAYALNGVSYPQCSEADFKKEGTIINLVDNDGDGKYDFVNLESYDTMLVSAVSVSSMKIHNEYTFDEGMRILDLSKYNEEKIHIFRNDDRIALAEIKNGDILSVFTTPKGVDGEIRIYVQDNQFEGIVESYSGNNTENPQAVIDGNVYEISELYIRANQNNEKSARSLKPATSYIFGCDRSGRIIFAKTIHNDEIMYGYAVKMFKNNDDGDDEIMLKMFMDDGSWVKYTLADKLKWNGRGGINSLSAYNNSEINASIPGLIGIKLDKEGEISVMETPIAYTSGVDRERLNTTGEVTANYRYNGTTFSNYYYMTSKTKVFIVPQDGSSDESFYAIGTNTSFKSDNSYTFEGYNRDEYYVLDMVVSKREIDTIQTVGDTLYMVRDVGMRFDEEHGVVSFINVASETYAGVSLYGEEGVFDDVREGDLIKIHTNSNGLIDNCSVIFAISNGVEKLLPTVNERHSASSVVKGVVEAIDFDGGKLLVDSAEEMAFMVSATTPVLIYDADCKSVTVGNLNDIEKGDFVNVSLSRSLVNILAVYKGLD